MNVQTNCFNINNKYRRTGFFFNIIWGYDEIPRWNRASVDIYHILLSGTGV